MVIILLTAHLTSPTAPFAFLPAELPHLEPQARIRFPSPPRSTSLKTVTVLPTTGREKRLWRWNQLCFNTEQRRPFSALNPELPKHWLRLIILPLPHLAAAVVPYAYIAEDLGGSSNASLYASHAGWFHINWICEISVVDWISVCSTARSVSPLSSVSVSSLLMTDRFFVCLGTAVAAAERTVPATSWWRWSSTRTWWTSSVPSRPFVTLSPTWWRHWWVQSTKVQYQWNSTITDLFRDRIRRLFVAKNGRNNKRKSCLWSKWTIGRSISFASLYCRPGLIQKIHRPTHYSLSPMRRFQGVLIFWMPEIPKYDGNKKNWLNEKNNKTLVFSILFLLYLLVFFYYKKWPSNTSFLYSFSIRSPCFLLFII